MRRPIILGLFALLLGCNPAPSGPAEAQGWRILNYWAEWCSPCRDEIPELNALSKETSVTVFGVNYDGVEGEALDALIKDFDIRFGSLSQEAASRLGATRPQVLPTTLILNPQDELVGTLVGPQTAESLRNFLVSQGWPGG
jgi:thiol-disulfide isomerase/thioredoxin